MKKLCALGIAITLMFFVSCGKQRTEAEKNAEIKRQVQQRLAAEHQADDQQKLAQREADLKAREDALAQKEQEPAPTTTPQMRASDIQQRDVTEAAQIADADDGEPASYNTFYTKLEPYGAWCEISDYGYVWQPNESERSRDWRPYTNGRWVYTDAGWTWDSEEPFGWATYHYGRWARLRSVGWVWIPGNEWAPAWVSWRKSDNYVGWAPLPPEAHFDRGRGIHNWADNYYNIGPDQYCFVATSDFGTQRTERTIVPVERNVTIVNQTINVTNITYNNTTIVNQGPNYDELRKRTRQPIQRLRLERRRRFENANPQAVVRGDVIEMTAPTIAPPRPADRPRTVKVAIAKPVVDHGWSDIRDKKASEQARAKIKAEATPPSDAPPSQVIQTQTQQTAAEPAQPVETPVRNFPERAKMKPHPSAVVAPSVKRTPLSSASPSRQETKDPPRQEIEKTPNEKAAQQQGMEAQRKTKAARNQSPPPVPVASASPRATPAARERPARSASTETKNDDKDKGNDKRNRETPRPSPSDSPR